jgi:hypothetical protein
MGSGAMHSSLGDLFHDWHDFYVLVGTASATLVGLMFVAASIGANVFNQDKQPAMSAFIGSTVVNFSTVLFICILAAIPSHTFATLGGLIVAAGLAGLIYSGRIWVQIFIRRSFAVDMMDRLFYGTVPVLGYLLVTIAGVMLLVRSTASPEVVAAALITLLLAGIHNAWDMMSWIVIRTSATPANPPSPPGNDSAS